MKTTFLDILSSAFSTLMKYVIDYIFIMKQSRAARNTSIVSKELFEESKEETGEKVMALFISDKI
jgi:hypothetical protein